MNSYSQHVGSSSLTRDGTQAPTLGSQSLRWTTREARSCCCSKHFMLLRSDSVRYPGTDTASLNASDLQYGEDATWLRATSLPAPLYLWQYSSGPAWKSFCGPHSCALLSAHCCFLRDHPFHNGARETHFLPTDLSWPHLVDWNLCFLLIFSFFI